MVNDRSSPSIAPPAQSTCAGHPQSTSKTRKAPYHHTYGAMKSTRRRRVSVCWAHMRIHHSLGTLPALKSCTAQVETEIHSLSERLNHSNNSTRTPSTPDSHSIRDVMNGPEAGKRRASMDAETEKMRRCNGFRRLHSPLIQRLSRYPRLFVAKFKWRARST